MVCVAQGMADKATVAWRSILLQLAGKLKQGEPQKIAFLADLPERFRTNDVGGEDVLERLQMDGFFSLSSPQGLFEIFTDLGRKDLAKQAKERVKDFQSKYGNSGNGMMGSSTCHCGRLEVELRSALIHMGAAEEHVNKLSPIHFLLSESLRVQMDIGLEGIKQVIRHFQALYKTVETLSPAAGAAGAQSSPPSADLLSTTTLDPSKEPNTDTAIYATLELLQPLTATVSPLVNNKVMNPYTSRPLPEEPPPSVDIPPPIISRPLPEQPLSARNSAAGSPVAISRPFQESACLIDASSTTSAAESSDNGDSHGTVIYTQPQEEDIIEKHDYSSDSSTEDPSLLMKSIGPVYEHVTALTPTYSTIQHHKKIQSVQNISNSSFSRSKGIRSPVRKGGSVSISVQQQYRGSEAAAVTQPVSIKNKPDDSGSRKNNDEDEEDGYCTFIKRDSPLLLKEPGNPDSSLDSDDGGHNSTATVPVP